jgi:hypothetical protein
MVTCSTWDIATPAAGGTAATKAAKAHAASGSADEAPVLPKGSGCSQRSTTEDRALRAPPHHKSAGDCLASGDSDDETDEFMLDAVITQAGAAVLRRWSQSAEVWQRKQWNARRRGV